MKNHELKEFYDRVYRKGERRHYSKILFGGKITEEKQAILKEISWKGKTVLDIGCGTGELGYLIASRAAKKVVGLDYAPEAIKLAKRQYSLPNLSYVCADVGNIAGRFDVIIMVGVLEHIDSPLNLLRKAKGFLRPGGSLIVTCPNWKNPRGYILQTLRLLFGARITLADFHYFTPVDFLRFSKRLKMALNWRTIELSWGGGDKLIKDLKKRLPNVLKPLPAFKGEWAIKDLISWLKTVALPLERGDKATGAVGLYHFKKK